MDPQRFNKQLIKKDNHLLQLIVQNKLIKIKLTIQVNKEKKQIYQITIKSLQDIKGLQSQFSNIDLFLQYLQDPQNIQLDLQNKKLRVIEFIKRTNKIVQICVIELLPTKLQQTSSASKEHQFLDQVLQRCQSKKLLSESQIKQMFQKMAMCLSQLLTQKMVLNAQNQQLLKKNKSLSEELDNLKNSPIKQENQHLSLNQTNLAKRQITSLKQYFQNRFVQIEKKIEKLSLQKLDKKQNMVINQQNSQKLQAILISKIKSEYLGELKKDIQMIQSKMGSSAIKQQNIMTENAKKTEAYNILNIKDLVDQSCTWGKNLQLNGNTMKAKKWAHVFGKKKLQGKCSFTVSFNKIDNNAVGIGVIDGTFSSKLLIQSVKHWVNYQNSGVCEVGGDIANLATAYYVGQLVTVEIDFEVGLIRWRVGADIRYQQEFSILKNKQINWVSYMYFGAQNISATVIC